MMSAEYQWLRIPRILHSIHLESGPLCPNSEARIRGWTAKPSDWKHHHWTQANLPANLGFKLDAQVPPVAQLAEIIKYGVLLHFGGIYFNSSLEFVQNLEPLLKDIESFWVYEASGAISDAIIGAVPSHSLISMIFRDLQLGLSIRDPQPSKTCQELVRRAMSYTFANNRAGIRLEVADTGKELGGLFEGNTALFASWVFLQRAQAIARSHEATPDYFAIDHGSPPARLDTLSARVPTFQQTYVTANLQATFSTEPTLAHVQPCLAVVIPTINRADLLLENLAVLLPQLAEVDHVLVIDNGRQGITIDSPKVRVREQPVNLGVAGSWNAGIQLALSSDSVSHLLVLNDDICLGPTQISDIITVIRDHPDTWFFVGPYYWSVWALSRQGAQAMEFMSGQVFDENFYPAYFKDNDFYYRLTSLYHDRYLGEIPEFTPAICRNSMTITKEPRRNLRFQLNQRYYVRKCGGVPEHETNPVTASGTAGKQLEDNGCTILQHYHRVCHERSDIFEHLPTLKAYASECYHITEFGVRTVVSTWAFLAAMPKTMRSYDIKYHPNVAIAENSAKSEGVDFKFIEQDVHSETCVIDETDLLFIDTLHTFDALSLELRKHAQKVRQYIIMHDTVTFGNKDELQEGGKGLIPALEQFLYSDPTWRVHATFSNNNGLTILKKCVPARWLAETEPIVKIS